MNRLRDPRHLLILLFLGIIAGVPMVQVIIEVREQNGVRAFDIFSRPPTAGNLRAYEHDLESANWAARLSRPWLEFGQFKWLRYGGEKVIIASDGWYFFKPALQFMISRPPEDHANGASTNDPLPAIIDFRDQLASHGIRLVLMPVPNKATIYPDLLTSRTQSLRHALSPRTRDFLNRLRAANVEFIDLFDEFRRAREAESTSADGSLYLAQDTHWSPAGVEIAARAAARRLTELGWMQPGNVLYEERPAPVKRLGDIVRMLRVPQIEREVAPETVPCVQVLGPDGNPYKDAADAEILVLGDSFLRIYQWDEPGSAGFIAHLARELRQPLISLINDGGGSTLVRRELRARPGFLKGRRVVLWEFVERDIGLGTEGWQKVPLGAASQTSSPPAADGRSE